MSYTAKALITFPDESEQQLEFDQDQVTIGRVESNDLCLDHPSISRTHARLYIGDNSLEIEDLGSSNGTFIDNTKIEERSPVKPSQTLRVGEVQLQLSLPAEQVKTAMMQAIKAPMEEQKTQVLSSVENIAEIEVIMPSGEVKPFTLAKEVTTVGRAENSDIFIADPTVSREHIHIVKEGKHFSFCKQPDCSGSVLHNGRKVEQGSLKDGDELVLGRAKLVFQPKAKAKMKQQKAKSRRIYLLLFILIATTAAVFYYYQVQFSDISIAERHIDKGSQALGKGNYFRAIAAYNQASPYKQSWTNDMKSEFYQGMAKAKLEQGLILLKSERWKESLLYFEGAITAAHAQIETQDLALSTEATIFDALKKYTQKLLRNNEAHNGQEIYQWLLPLYQETRQAELDKLQQSIEAKAVAFEFEEKILQKMADNQGHLAVVDLKECMQQSSEVIPYCKALVDSYHVQIYDWLNQANVAARLNRDIKSSDLEPIVENSQALTLIKPGIPRYQTLYKEVRIFHQNILAKEKLQQELKEDDLDLDAFQ